MMRVFENTRLPVKYIYISSALKDSKTTKTNTENATSQVTDGPIQKEAAIIDS